MHVNARCQQDQILHEHKMTKPLLQLVIKYNLFVLTAIVNRIFDNYE